MAFAVRGLAGQDFGMCMDCCVDAGGGDWGTTPCIWVELSARADDLITFRNPTPCLRLVLENTSCSLQFNFILLRWELQL